MPLEVAGAGLRALRGPDTAPQASGFLEQGLAATINGASLQDLLAQAMTVVEREVCPKGTACLIADVSGDVPKLDGSCEGRHAESMGAVALAVSRGMGDQPRVISFASPEDDGNDVAEGELPVRLRAASLGLRAAVVLPVRAKALQLALIVLLRQPVDAGDALVDALAAVVKQLGMLLHAHDAIGTVRDVGKRFAALAGSIPGVIYQRRVSPNGSIRYVYISENAYDLFGVSAERILSDPEALFKHYSPDYRETFRKKLLEASRDMTLWDVEAKILRPDGEVRYTHAIARPEREPDGSVLWTGVILDSTRIKLAELAAAAAEARTRKAIVESLSQGLLMFDSSDRLILSNSHFDKLYPDLVGIIQPGADYAEIIRAELDPEINPQVQAFDANDELVDRLLRHGERHLVYERVMSDDRCILVNEYRTDDDETVILYTDITELKRRERKIEHLAHHDSLTGLPNRILFNQKLQDLLAASGQDQARLAVLCLDLDRFKSVNDTLGHQIGDKLLMAVAKRIETALRDHDLASRLGGDEFAVIVPGVTTPEMLSSIAYRLLQAFAEPFEVDGHSIVSGTSIGIAVSGQDGEDAETLLKNADLALYRAKADGRGTFRFFEADMDSKAQARRMLEIALRSAIARKELEVHYQPLVDIHTSQIIGAEALLRWNRTGIGYVPPLEFIPLAEETGLIADIGEWVLRRAATDACSWPDDIRIAVNISPAQFRNPHFAGIVKQILVETGLDPTRLELEITESMLLRNTDANLQILRELKDLGVRVSMDDFGTGYSSLGNLRSFPFDKIKIDKSFIADLNRSADAAAIIRAILALGRSLGMTTTAEGVENRDQLAYLRAEGCVEVQGHYFATALENEQLTQLIARNVSGRRQGFNLLR